MVNKTALFMPWRQRAVVFFSALACGSALAQWQWVDETGRRVFSDTAPPLSVPEKNILKRPGSHAQPASPPAPVAAPNETLEAPKLSTRDSALEARKKQAEEAEQAKKKADEERQAKLRAESCERAQRAKATLDSGIRLATTNAKGEREILDDAGRAAEAKRLDGIIRADCGPK
jgi:hypothetical protein